MIPISILPTYRDNNIFAILFPFCGNIRRVILLVYYDFSIWKGVSEG